MPLKKNKALTTTRKKEIQDKFVSVPKSIPISAIPTPYLKKKRWAKVADIARLQAVLKMGGIYLDTDFELHKPLTSMLKHRCFYAFQEERPSADWVCNGIFGAEPDHWFEDWERDGMRPTSEAKSH